MRNLYEELLQKGEQGILDLVAQQRQESVDLEFKEKAVRTKGDLDDNDARNLGKELSAFSNSMGGLLIWGVRAKKLKPDDLDCATDALPIANIAKFKSDVIRRGSLALMPRHDGIFVESIPSSTSGAGYLLVLVDRSERRPHRSEVAGDKHYYKRAGDSAVMMEHFDVEDAFKRFTVASLDLRYQVGGGGSVRSSTGNWYIVHVMLTLENKSKVSARHPYLIVDSFGAELREHGKGAGILARSQGASRMYYTGADVIIHPELSLDMVGLEFKVPMRITEAFPRTPTMSPDFSNVPPLVVAYRSGCDNARAQSGCLTISIEEMARVLPAEQ